MHKILIVDDNKLNIKIVREAMNFLGYAVVEAYDGVEGIEKAKHEMPDLVFMDIHMSKMDGIEAMKRIKEVPALKNVPVIAYTAYAMKGDREKFLHEGFDEYLPKPVSLTCIKDTAQKLLIGQLKRANERQTLELAERKRTEVQIKASLHEKELLLREIHHRVKNNMQVISSLLRLQADRIKDKGYAEMLKESQLRIQSMSLIHEKLYQSKDFANIDFKGYVKTLANTLIKSHGVDSDKIRLIMEIEDVSLDIENTIPCGLIINELISNSLKYAFPEGNKGEIGISLKAIDEERLELIVSDDGVGLPEDMDIGNDDTLGLYLVEMLAKHQLEGELELHRKVGTQYSIRFKKQEYKPRI